MPEPQATIRRGFVDVAEGQVHYRTAGSSAAAGPPLVLLHASPGSAKTLEPLLAAFADTRRVIAPDTLGNGDSSAPASRDAELSYFAAAHVRALDALGVHDFDLYGTHTGANLAIEIALSHPERVRSLILDGISLYSEEERTDMLTHYLPDVQIDATGSQLHLIWHFVRDAYLFWPWYRRDKEHRRAIGLPSATDLHDKTLEVLKAASTFHISYRAALAYRKEDRLPALRVPTLLACSATDMLIEYLEKVGGLLPQARQVTTPGVGSPEAARRTAEIFEAFMRSPAPAKV